MRLVTGGPGALLLSGSPYGHFNDWLSDKAAEALYDAAFYIGFDWGVGVSRYARGWAGVIQCITEGRLGELLSEAIAMTEGYDHD